MFLEALPNAQHRRPLVVAAIATSVLVPLIYLLFVNALTFAKGRNPLADSNNFMLGTFYVMCIGVLVSSFSMFVVGWPLLMALKRCRWLTWPMVCFTAVLAGLAGITAMGFVFFSSSPDGEDLLYGAAIGGVAGAIFSLIAGIGWRRRC